jgi:hypothetical protein
MSAHIRRRRVLVLLAVGIVVTIVLATGAFCLMRRTDRMKMAAKSWLD